MRHGQHFARLKQMHLQRCTLPDYAKPAYKFKPTTTNGLTNCIIHYINYTGHQAERVTSSGRHIDGDSFVDVIGRTRTFKGKWIPGQTTRGTADIGATKSIVVWRPNPPAKMVEEIIGLKVAIEVKNLDRQSNDQLRYQKKIEQSGGVYIIARVNQFDKFVETWEAL